MQRDVIKTMSFAVMHFSVAFAIAYALTGSIAIATGISLLEPIVNTIAFYFHERAWRHLETPAAVATTSVSLAKLPVFCRH